MNPPRTQWERLVCLLNTDFCPDLNRYVYWLKNPFWLLVLTFATSVMCGIFVNAAILMVSVGLLIFTCLGLIYPRVALWGIECRIRFQRSRCRSGQTTEVETDSGQPLAVSGLGAGTPSRVHRYRS